MLLTKDYKPRFKKDALLVYAIPSIAIFIISAAVTVWIWEATTRNVDAKRNTAALQETADIKSALIQRLDTYQEILRGSAGFVAASDKVTSAEWQKFISNYDLPKRYPGVQAIGYAVMIEPQNLESFQVAMQQEVRPDYAISPSGERAIYSAIQFIEPQSPRNINALGYDMYSDPTRRTAMDLAAQTNQPVITSRVTLVQDKGTTLAGFLMYYPIYDKNCPLPIDSKLLPSCTVRGYSYAPFRAEDLFNNTVPAQNNASSGFRIFDGAGHDASTLLYQSPNFEAIDSNPYRTIIQQIKLYSQTWTLEVRVPNAQSRIAYYDRSSLLLVGGLLLSLLTSVGFFLFLLSRTRSLERTKDFELQSVKDELLSLAAHQLRTPATAVKQYVGMMREGYGGELTEQQQKLINRAFESNERQLQIVNEMLYVANADAGKLRLMPKVLNLTRLVREVVDEQREEIAVKGQKLILKLPSKPIHYEADNLFLSMALGNLLNNAQKYTPEGGKIKVSLTRNAQWLLITVQDSGVGIPKQQIPLLFKKFSRIDNSLSNTTIGTGLGLYLAAKLIQMHDGYIKVHSKVNHGTSFVIVLPRKKPKLKQQGG